MCCFLSACVSVWSSSVLSLPPANDNELFREERDDFSSCVWVVGLEEKKKKPAWLLFLHQFKDFMILVLIAAAVIAGIIYAHRR